MRRIQKRGKQARKKQFGENHLLRLESPLGLTAATNILAIWQIAATNILAIWQIAFHETDHDGVMKVQAHYTGPLKPALKLLVSRLKLNRH